MARFFVEKEQLCGELVCVDGENARHIMRSLRMREGEEISLSDGEGNDVLGVIESSAEGCVYVKVLERKKNESEPATRLTIYQGLPKSDKLELIVQKAVELGAAEIVPVETEFCVAKAGDKERTRKKTERLNKIALEAAKQSGRGRIPRVCEAMSFSEALSSAKDKLKLLFYERGGGSLKEALAGSGDDVAVFIGAEGGFSEAEVRLAQENGAVIINLGKRILRTETAAIAVATMVMYEKGELE